MDGGIRRVADAFQIGYQCRHRGPNRPAASTALGSEARWHSAVRAPVARHAVLRDDGRPGRDFHLSQHLRRTIEQFQLPAAVGTTIQCVRNRLVDGLGRIRPQMLFVTRLPAPLTLLSSLCRGWRLHEIAGGRLGGVRGVLFRFRQFRLQGGDPLLERAVALATAASIIASTCFRVKTTLAMPP